ncbi:MAG: FkbM family methyltransferase [Sphingobacteriia bacterium]|nr:MAG: FkbM family methyltransferase [Sphingobacteriia bacterium]
MYINLRFYLLLIFKITVMASRIKSLIQYFGLSDGIKIYLNLKIKEHGKFYSSKLKSHFKLRANTPDGYTFRQVFVDQQYDIELPFHPLTIIDGGSNIGLAALFFSNRYPKAEVVAVEPSKYNFDTILENTTDIPQIKVYNNGLWNKDIFLKITNDKGSENAFMVSETAIDSLGAFPALSIETIMHKHDWKTIDILKLDIEGSEKEVFESNYEYWLPRTKAIFIEIHDQMRKGASKSVFKAIGAYNFSFTMKHENLIFINEDLL